MFPSFHSRLHSRLLQLHVVVPLTVISACWAGCGPAPLCGDDGVVRGSVSLRSDSEVQAMAGCTSVTGDLSLGDIPPGAFGLGGESPTSLAPLSSLTRVDGNVTLFAASQALTSLAGLENLER